MGMPPLGAVVLATHLESRGYRTRIVDLALVCRSGLAGGVVPSASNLPDLFGHHLSGAPAPGRSADLDLLVARIGARPGDLVGFSVFSPLQYASAVALAREVKRRTPGAIVVFGGAHITTWGHLYYPAEEAIDFAILGPGERPIETLLAHLAGERGLDPDDVLDPVVVPLGPVPGEITPDDPQTVSRARLFLSRLSRFGTAILSRRDGRIRVTNSGPPLSLEEQACPRFDILDLEPYRVGIGDDTGVILAYQAGRGCARRCTFCMHHLQGHVESRSADRIRADLVEIERTTPARHLFFADSAINDSLRSVLAALEGDGAPAFAWGSFARLAGLSVENVRRMRSAGCRFVVAGVESGSEGILARIGKATDLSAAQRTLAACRESAIAVVATFIAGYPGETEADVEATERFLERAGRHFHAAGVNRLRVDPGTALHLQPGSHGIAKIESRLTAYGRGLPVYPYEALPVAGWIDPQASLDRVRRAIEAYVGRNAALPPAAGCGRTFGEYFAAGEAIHSP